MSHYKLKIWFSHCLLALFLSLGALADTLVSGYVEGFWTVANSPYWVDSTIVVAGGKSLFINPGVIVIFQDTDSLKVFGKLTVSGDSTDSVRFTEAGKSNWGGIWLLGGSHDCSFLYATISKPRFGIGILYGLETSQPRINYSSIHAQISGVYALDSYFLLQNSTIEANEGTDVNVIRLLGSNPIIYNCLIISNSDIYPTQVKGIFIQSSEPVIQRCAIQLNTIGRCYGIYLIESSKALLEYNLITAVSEYYAYGGYLIFSSSDLINNTIAVQSNQYDAKGLYIESESDPLIENCILYGDGFSVGIEADDGASSHPVIRYTDIFNQAQNTVNCSPGIGCLSVDPSFVDPGGYDFNLTSHSLCINAGNPDSRPLDPDSTFRDMGCYFFDLSTGIFPSGPQNLPTDFSILEVYPNPFNAFTSIQINLPQPQSGTLTIFNGQGRKVEGFEISSFPAGVNRFIWDANQLSSGLYWVEWRTSFSAISKPMTLIK